MAKTADPVMRDGPSPRELGRNLRQVRRKQGLSRAEVARSAGLTRRELAAYERGRTDVPESDLWCLAGSCGVDVSELLPERAPLRIGSGLSALAVGDSIRQLQTPSEPDGVLREYLAMVYELRNLPAGSRVPLREPDLLALADALGGTPEAIEDRLVELIGASHEEAARLRAMILPPLSLPSGNANGNTIGNGNGSSHPRTDPYATLSAPDPADVIDFFSMPRAEDPFSPPPDLDALTTGMPAVLAVETADASAPLEARLPSEPDPFAPDPAAPAPAAPEPAATDAPLLDPFAAPLPPDPSAGNGAADNGNGHHDVPSIVVDDPFAPAAPALPVREPVDMYVSDTPLLAETPETDAVFDEPVYEAPVFDEPILDAPIHDESTIDAPVIDESVIDVSLADLLPADVPPSDAPDIDAPLTDSKAIDVTDLVVDAPDIDDVAPIAWVAQDRTPAAVPTSGGSFQQVGSGWRVGGIFPATAMADDGALALRRADARWALADQDAPGDFTIEATVDFTAGAGFGVLIRATVDDHDRISGYSFDIDPVAGGGGYLVRQWEDNRQHWRPIAQASVTDASRLYGRHTLQVVLAGDHLTAGVDGETVLSVPGLSHASIGLGREPCRGGGIGVQAWATTEVTVDTFRVARA